VQVKIVFLALMNVIPLSPHNYEKVSIWLALFLNYHNIVSKKRQLTSATKSIFIISVTLNGMDKTSAFKRMKTFAGLGGALCLYNCN